jgi:glycosyltransferase involved in cell wall biosynthesis
VTSFGAREETITTIYNPLDVDRLLAAVSSGTAVVPKREHPEDVWIVVAAALKRVKGHAIALRALSLLPQSFRLFFVGDGPLRDALIAEARRLRVDDRVAFVGWCPNAAAWLAAADVVWVPSEVEGFGLVLLEAVALGTPVIASAAGGLVEVARIVETETVPVGDHRALAAATLRLQATGETSGRPRFELFAPPVVAERYSFVLSRCHRRDAWQRYDTAGAGIANSDSRTGA